MVTDTSPTAGHSVNLAVPASPGERTDGQTVPKSPHQRTEMTTDLKMIFSRSTNMGGGLIWWVDLSIADFQHYMKGHIEGIVHGCLPLSEIYDVLFQCSSGVLLRIHAKPVSVWCKSWKKRRH